MKYIVNNEEEWHKLRSQVVTASEAAVLVGADPYSSPKAIREPSTFTGNAFTLVGQMLEPIVVKIVNQVLGMNFELFEQEEGVKEFYIEGHLGATPDAHQDRKILLECKTTRPKSYLKYSGVPPSKYLIQLIVQMICTCITEGYLAILSTDLTQQTADLKWPITIYKIRQNDELCSILIAEAERFKTAKTFRVSSKVKQKVRLLLTMSYERII